MNQNITRTYWPYIFSGFGALLALGFLDNIRGPFYPDVIHTLGLTETQAAWFFATPSLVMVLGSIITPKMLTLMTPLWALRIGLLSMGLGFMSFGFISDFYQMLLSGFVFGLGFGIVNVMQNYMIQVGAQTHLRQRLFSGLHANYAGAAILVSFAVSFLKHWGWSKVFLVMGALPIVIALFTFLSKESLDHMEVRKKKDRLPNSVFWQALLVSAGFAFYLTAELGLSTRLVHFLETDLGYSKEVANYHFLGLFVGMFLSRVIFTKVTLPVQPITLIATGAIGTTVAVFVCLFYQPWATVAAGFFIGPIFPAFLEYINLKFPLFSDRVLAISLSVSAIGEVIMHNVVGYLSETMGIQKALMVSPFGAVIFVMILGYHHKMFKGR